jgi:hypothetical protein
MFLTFSSEPMWLVFKRCFGVDAATSAAGPAMSGAYSSAQGQRYRGLLRNKLEIYGTSNKCQSKKRETLHHCFITEAATAQKKGDEGFISFN